MILVPWEYAIAYSQESSLLSLLRACAHTHTHTDFGINTAFPSLSCVSKDYLEVTDFSEGGKSTDQECRRKD